MANKSSVPESDKVSITGVVTPPPSFNVRAVTPQGIVKQLESALSDADTLKHTDVEHGRNYAIVITELEKVLAYIKVYLG